MASRALARQRPRRNVLASTARRRPSRPQALRLRRLVLRGAVVPETAEAALLRRGRGAHAAVARAGGLGVEHGGGLGRGRLGVGGQPGREGAAFVGVVVAEDAADVGVVVGVAVGVAGEEGGAEGGDLGGGFGEDVGVPGRHGGDVLGPASCWWACSCARVRVLCRGLSLADMYFCVRLDSGHERRWLAVWWRREERDSWLEVGDVGSRCMEFGGFGGGGASFMQLP